MNTCRAVFAGGRPGHLSEVLRRQHDAPASHSIGRLLPRHEHAQQPPGVIRPRPVAPHPPGGGTETGRGRTRQDRPSARRRLPEEEIASARRQLRLCERRFFEAADVAEYRGAERRESVVQQPRQQSLQLPRAHQERRQGPPAGVSGRREIG